MASVRSATNTQAVQGLTQRQNQIVLDGTVGAVLKDGSVYVSLQDATDGVFVSPVIDHQFSVGEPVMVARANDGNFVLFGLGQSKADSTPQSLTLARQPLTIASQSLHEAIQRLIAKKN